MKKLGSKSNITPKAKVHIIEINKDKRVSAMSVPDLKVNHNTSRINPKTNIPSLLFTSFSKSVFTSASIAPCPRE